MFDWLTWLGSVENLLVVLKVLVGLNLVIFVHELGHFAVAKMCGVKCEKFYIWFDPPLKLGWGKYSIRLPSRICKFQWGETEYGIGVLPLGGYVKMLGQDDNPSRAAEAVRQARLHADTAKSAGATSAAPSGTPVADSPNKAPAPAHAVASAAQKESGATDQPVTAADEEKYVFDPRSYMAKSVPQRMAIISAGVIMNIIFAVIFATIAYSMGVPYDPAVVAQTTAGGGAWRANFQSGDRILKIRDKPIERFVDLRSEVTSLANRDLAGGVDVLIDRGGKEMTLNVKPQSLQNNIVILGVVGPRSLRIFDKEHALPNTPAAAAGFQDNDVVEKVNGQPVASYTEYLAAEARDPQKPLTIQVRRGGVSEPTLEDAGAISGGKSEFVTVAPRAYRDLGFRMSFGPIKAVQDDSPAAKAGVEPGDELVSVNGTSVNELDPMLWPQQFAEQHFATPDQANAASTAKTKLIVKRDGKTIDLELVGLLAPRSDVNDISQIAGDLLGISYTVSATIAGVDPGSAGAAKLRAGDKIVDFQLEPVDDDARKKEIEESGKNAIVKAIPIGDDEDDSSAAWPSVLRRIQSSLPTTKVILTVKRGGATEKVTLPIVAREGRFLADRGILFEPWKRIERGENLAQSAAYGFRETGYALTAVVRFLRKIWYDPGAGKNLGSVLTIGAAAGMAAKEGIADLLIFMTLISANLAVINFLPIPVLDGGHMVFLAYEGIRGKPADERVFGILTMIGFVLLMSLMLFVFGLDINRFFIGK